MQISLQRYFVCYKSRVGVCSSRGNEGIDHEDSVLISEFLNVFANGRGGVLEDSLRSDDHNTGDEKIASDTTKLFHVSSTNCNTIKPMGRLNEEPEGLLLLTNDSSFFETALQPRVRLEEDILSCGEGQRLWPHDYCWVL
mmetsp:Transcript_24914/g.45042  ORF Transcript_24914/g.45042 Transcript_24914/m.45042 type:complete len:140 (-) Transcript_24914:1324-1743(-)